MMPNGELPTAFAVKRRPAHYLGAEGNFTVLVGFGLGVGFGAGFDFVIYSLLPLARLELILRVFLSGAPCALHSLDQNPAILIDRLKILWRFWRDIKPKIATQED